MLNLLLSSVIPLDNYGCKPYSGMASDGRNLYISASGAPLVFQMSMQGEMIERLKTRRPYRSICYDCSGHVFWGLAENGRSLYQLSSRFQETDCIPVRLPHFVPASSLGYSYQNRTLLLCTQHAVYSLTACGTVQEVYDSGQAWCQAAGELHGYFTLCSQGEHSPGIIRVADHTGCLSSVTCIPDFHRPKSICAIYQEDNCGQLYLLSCKKECYSFLLGYRYVDTEREEPACSCKEQSELSDMVCVQTVQID